MVLFPHSQSESWVFLENIVEPKAYQLFAELEKRKLSFTMTNTLRLRIFNPATWDIFQMQDEHYIQTRVTRVRFGIRHDGPFVASFETCRRLEGEEWRDVKMSLNKLFFENIGGSQATHDAEGKLMCVVFPRSYRFKEDWIGSVFYPSGVDVSLITTRQVIGWADPFSPIYNQFDTGHYINQTKK